MAIVKKPADRNQNGSASDEKPPSEEEIQRRIRGGGVSAGDPIKSPETKLRWHSAALHDRVKRVVEANSVKISLNQWVLQACLEKAEREEADAELVSSAQQ